MAEAASVGLPVYISTGVDIYPFFKNERERLIFDISTEQDIEKALSTLDKISDDDLQYLGSFCREVALKTHIPHPKLSQREITERKNQSEHKNKHKERKKAFEKQ